jgi:hypothetical protein
VDPIDPTDIPDDTEAEEDEHNECIPPKH